MKEEKKSILRARVEAVELNLNLSEVAPNHHYDSQRFSYFPCS